MPKFKITSVDQMNTYTHYEQAPDKETAMKRFKSGHYGSILECEEVVPVIQYSQNKVDYIICAQGTCHNEDSARAFIVSNGTTIGYISEKQIKELAKLI